MEQPHSSQLPTGERHPDMDDLSEQITAENAPSLKGRYYDELLRLQGIEAQSERDKDKIISLARRIILCSEVAHHGKEGDSRLGEERSSGFSKSTKERLYRRLGGCLACGGGTMTRASRHQSPIELHHIVPRVYGGDDAESNALLICRGCHVGIHS